jgi:predicted AlkP superfamily phosphohydrolase/phosphomutase
MKNFFDKKAKRAFVLGLDCAAPELIFNQFRHELPTLSGLMQRGTWGTLESSLPCITVPAWASMLSSRDPGVLGVYGFRNRANHTYESLITADSDAIPVKRIWDYLSDAGKQSVVVSVPQTYPPRPLKGAMVSCFLTPNTDSGFTYPALLKQEVLKVVPDYQFDVREFRTPDKSKLHQQLLAMTSAQFRLVEHLIATKPWDFFMHVNIGVDRLHHGFWRYHDPHHRLYEAGSPFEHVIRDYYILMDMHLKRLIEKLGDDTMILVVSDHGVKRMDGGICINEWLWKNGWLAFKTPPEHGHTTPFDNLEVDWAQTKAWASGGYYGRVFLNVEGREPQGTIPAQDYEATRSALAAALCAIPDHEGKPLATQAYRPQDIYTQVNGIPPDLLVYFGDLHWRAVGSLGHGAHFTLENDTGPDDANHAQHGMFILFDPTQRGRSEVAGHQLMDIAPTLLQRMGQKIPPEMQGKVIR